MFGNVGEVRAAIEELRDEIIDDGGPIQAQTKIEEMRERLAKVVDDIRGIIGEVTVIEAERGDTEMIYAGSAAERDLQTGRANEIATEAFHKYATDAVGAIAQAATVATDASGVMASGQEVLSDLRDQLLAAKDKAQEAQRLLQFTDDDEMNPYLIDCKAAECLDLWAGVMY